MNALDLIVIAGIALSALFAFARGFVKEVLSIAAWVGAAAIALYGFAPARPVARQLISSPMLADLAAGFVLFVGSLIVLSLITSTIAKSIKHSSLSAVDRALGLVFGVVRGVLVACLAFLALSWALQGSEPPIWIRDARTRPFLASGAELIKSFIPPEARERGATTAVQAQQTLDQAQEAERFMRALATPTPAAPSATARTTAPAPTGYKPAQRKEMDQLIQSTQ
jgi:membrane protein required for colicin V production